MALTEFGMDTDVMSHDAKALLPIEVTVLGIVTEFSLRQLLKVPSLMVVIQSGIITEDNSEQLENA